jgi:hypothetical protein
MTISEEARAANDARVAKDIREYGCHVISVFDPEERLPTFSYSIGIQETTGAPELIVLGLRPALGHALVNAYCRKVRAGERFERGTRYAGFLDGFEVYLEPVPPKRAAEYLLGCERHYAGRPYAVVQLVYPSTRGAWPWRKSASPGFVAIQPMLGRRRPDRS